MQIVESPTTMMRSQLPEDAGLLAEPQPPQLTKKRSNRVLQHFNSNPEYIKELERMYFKMDSIDSNGQKKKSWVMVNPDMEEVLRDRAESETNFIFDNKVFCEYGLYHLLFLVFLGPFSAPIIAAISGWMVVKNLHFFNRSLLCLGQTLVWAAFMYTMICFFTPSTTVIYTSELIYVLLSIIMRIVVIACKYATYSPADLHLLKHSLYSIQEIENKQYVQGWMFQKVSVVHSQIHKSLFRNEFEEMAFFVQFMKPPSESIISCINEANSALKEYYIAIYSSTLDPVQQTKYEPNSFLQIVLGRQQENPIFYCYGVLNYLLENYKTHHKNTFRMIVIIANISSLFKMMLPCIFRWYDDIPILGNSIYEGSGIVLMAILSYSFQSIIQMFIMFGIHDLSRLIFLQGQLSYMIMARKDHCKYQFGCTKLLPTINIFHNLNLSAWLMMRKVSIEYGKDFFLRIQMLFSVTFLMVFAMAFIAALEVFGILRIDHIFERLVFVELIQLGVEVLVIILMCASINDFFQIHQDLLSANKDLIMDLYSLRDIYFQKEKDKLVNYVHQTGVQFINDLTQQEKTKINHHLKQLLDTYDDLLLYLQTQKEVEPFTLLGLQVDSSFVKSFITGFLSVVGSFIYVTILQSRMGNL